MSNSVDLTLNSSAEAQKEDFLKTSSDPSSLVPLSDNSVSDTPTPSKSPGQASSKFDPSDDWADDSTWDTDLTASQPLQSAQSAQDDFESWDSDPWGAASTAGVPLGSAAPELLSTSQVPSIPVSFSSNESNISIEDNSDIDLATTSSKSPENSHLDFSDSIPSSSSLIQQSSNIDLISTSKAVNADSDDLASPEDSIIFEESNSSSSKSQGPLPLPASSSTLEQLTSDISPHIDSSSLQNEGAGAALESEKLVALALSTVDPDLSNSFNSSDASCAPISIIDEAERRSTERTAIISLSSATTTESVMNASVNNKEDNDMDKEEISAKESEKTTLDSIEMEEREFSEGSSEVVDLAQMRHIKSKLDVLTRILEERERQLSSRSSKLTEVQNENAELRAELDVFKSAQAKTLASPNSHSKQTLIEALQEEFSERIGSMEKKYRLVLKERERLLEQVKMKSQQYEALSTQLEATKGEIATYRASDKSATLSDSQATLEPPSTPSRVLVDSAISSISSFLSPPPTPPATPTNKSPSLTLEEELRAEGLALHEKLQRYQVVVREFKAREKTHLAEIDELKAKVISLSSEVQTHSGDRNTLEIEANRAKESEKKVKMAMEAQKEALDLKAKQLAEKTATTEAFEREVAGLKSELESSWRLNESLRKEIDQKRVEEEESRQQLESRYQALHLESSAALVSKSTQQQQMLQNTIEELRNALDGNRTLKSTQEEALEARILDLESALLSAEQHLTIARQNADLSQTPLLKQISDLQSQLAHQQRALEAVEEAWKSRAQALEASLAASSQDLTNAQSQLRSAEMSSNKLQSQYARLEHQHQTLQVEFDQLSLEASAIETDKDALNQTIDSLKVDNQALNAKITTLGAKYEETISDQKATISKLESQVSTLNQRIASFTTPGYSSASLGFTNLPSSHLSSTGSTSPTSSRGHSLASSSSSTNLSMPPSAFTPQKSAHTTNSLETQLSLLRSEKARTEEMLSQALHAASKTEALESTLHEVEEEKRRLKERLDAALELVAEQSERLQFSDEEVAETKQLYKQEIAHLVAQLQETQDLLHAKSTATS